MGLLPPGAAHALDALAGLDGLPAYYEAPLDLEPAYVDPAAGGLLDAMFVVVVTYAALLAVYMALSSMIDEVRPRHARMCTHAGVCRAVTAARPARAPRAHPPASARPVGVCTCAR